jgi:hypothetical protein
MVVGLYGLLYAYAALRLDRARPIIFVGLAGKILGPIGWSIAVHSGEWPARTFPLIVFNDLVWWLPFALFLLDDTEIGARVRRTTPWICALLNLLAAVAMLFWLRGGTEVVPSFSVRASYITEHAVLWRTGWVIWMMAAISLVAFYVWWGSWIPSSRTAIVAFLISIAGLTFDLFAEALFVGWLPERIEALGSLGTLFSGAVANGLYGIAGALLTLGTPSLGGTLRVWAWMIWITAFGLTACTLIGNVTAVAIATAILMSLLSPWVALFGWKIARDNSATALERK